MCGCINFTLTILCTSVAHKPNLLDPELNVVFTPHIELDQVDKGTLRYSAIDGNQTNSPI